MRERGRKVLKSVRRKSKDKNKEPIRNNKQIRPDYPKRFLHEILTGSEVRIEGVESLEAAVEDDEDCHGPGDYVSICSFDCLLLRLGVKDNTSQCLL